MSGSPPPRRIGLVMQGGPDWLGGMQYVLNLGRTLKWHLEDGVTVVLLGVGVPPPLSLDVADESVWEPQLERRRDKALRWLAFQTLGRNTSLDRALRRARLDFVFPYFPGLLPSIPSATWIPDLQHLAMPEMFSRREVFMRNRNFTRVSRHASSVVVSSNTARAEVLERYPSSRNKLRVLTFSTFAEAAWFEGDPSSTCRQYQLPPKFFLVSNQFWRHKNHELLFSAVELLKRRGIEVSLVCTGRMHDYRSPEYAPELVAGLERRGLGVLVRCLGVIPRSDQIQLMRSCLAVVQPSLFEGWSTVVEDARTLGKPIILSDLTVHLEQAPPLATYFARHDREALADALESTWIRPPIATPNAELEAFVRAQQRSRLFAEDFMRLVPS